MSLEPENTATSPPPLGGSYAKARKAYGLVSALLLAWELVGIEIEPTPVETLKISLKSPQAAPYVLIALVVYFAFHFTVEWHQAPASRRQLLASRIDFIAAHLIGGGALILFGAQTLFRIQVANVFPPRALSWFSYGMFFGVADTLLWAAIYRGLRRWRRQAALGKGEPAKREIRALLRSALPLLTLAPILLVLTFWPPPAGLTRVGQWLAFCAGFSFIVAPRLFAQSLFEGLRGKTVELDMG